MTSTSTQGAAPSATGSEVGRARLQQSLEARQQLPIDTRMTYLEEDVEDERHHTNARLKALRDQTEDNQRQESEDILKLHEELSENVTELERDISASFTRIENTLEVEVQNNKEEIEKNREFYYNLNNGLYRTIDFVRHVEYLLEDRIYMLEEQMKKVTEDLLSLKRMSTDTPTQTTQATTDSTESSTSTGIPTEPGVGGVGDTGGNKAARIMSEARTALQEWMDSRKSTTEMAAAQESSEAESKTGRSQSKTLEELLYELNNYNM